MVSYIHHTYLTPVLPGWTLKLKSQFALSLAPATDLSLDATSLGQSGWVPALFLPIMAFILLQSLK